jgi:hopanoid biosynthesis associated radical SAM protein HpnH
MAVPIRQGTRMGMYLLRQRLEKREKFPLIVELEPLFQCNLACSGCGKIQHPEHELRRRMPVEQAIGAIEESGAPMVSIAGGEPLIHPEIHTIAAELVKRKKFVYLCTNALLLCTWTACASAMTSRSSARASLTWRCRRSRRPRRPVSG